MISILMPIYNGIEFINDSVVSILNQTYTKWELVIGINGHPQNSDVYKIAKEYEKFEPTKIKVYDLYTKGKSNTLNEMIKLCKYKHVAILDVDDIWLPTKLEEQIPYIDKYDVVGTRCIYFGNSSHEPTIPIGDLCNFDFFKFNPVINSSSIIKKELCFWDGNEDGVEDYDMWLRLKMNGKRFYNCDKILVKHRIHNSSFYNANGNHNHVGNLLKKYISFT